MMINEGSAQEEDERQETQIETSYRGENEMGLE